ncbi:MAG: hypothetical protein AAFN10_12550 [Bacteroidota bacterium]
MEKLLQRIQSQSVYLIRVSHSFIKLGSLFFMLGQAFSPKWVKLNLPKRVPAG